MNKQEWWIFELNLTESQREKLHKELSRKYGVCLSRKQSCS